MESIRSSWGAREIEVLTTDVAVVGSGIAGLFAAMDLASTYHVTVLTKAGIERSSTEEAQGGIAAALTPEDSPHYHYQDTLKAGADLCNEEAVRVLTHKGPEYVLKLMAMGVEFDRVQGELDFVREAAHTYKRILHAGGDATGQVIQRRLAANARQDGLLRIEENCFVIDLLKNADGAVVGVLALRRGQLTAWLAKAVILAAGGLGQLYRYTSNPEVLTGDGMAAALRAGAELMNMEFIQFHPTVFLQPDGKCFLISESARGAGARLINDRGEFFMDAVPGKEMAPRDIVARAIWDELTRSQVYLDFSPIAHKNIRESFPQIYANCRKGGVDIEKQPVPVMPAAHYSMGGVRVDMAGRTNLKNLFACGECSCNGVHGANRLASNSLLDGLVFGSEVALTLEHYITGDKPQWDGVIKPLEAQTLPLEAQTLPLEAQTLSLGMPQEPSEGLIQEKPLWSGVSIFPDDSEGLSREETAALRRELTALMWDKVGIIRNEAGLQEALEQLRDLSGRYKPALRQDNLELGNLLALGQVIALSALHRRESRGGHYRDDYPESSASFRKNSIYKRGNDHHDRVEFISL